ncbi:LexA/Signal peptidase, partial [Jaminaea rosea]
SAWSHRLRSTRPYLVRGLQIACLLHVITTHLFEVRGCEGPSMLPTLSPQGDWLLQVRLPFARWLEGLRASERTGAGAGMPWKTRISKKDPTCGLPLRIGDMVVSASPRNPSRYVCKRIVGLPGDRVLMDPRVQLGERKGPDLYVTVPVGHVFLTGDNLSHSTDSRHYGPVPLGCIKGKVVARVS